MKPSHSSSILQELILSTFFLLTFIISLAIFFNPDIYYVLLRQDKDDYPANYNVSAPEKTREKLPFAIGEGDKKCNIFNGSWVKDYSRPLYEEWECPFLGGDVTCLKNGRPDKDFRHWRWQPHGCSIHSFNATLMLESLRGKKMMFVGDSLNRNQFISMICLLHKNISKHATSTKRVDSSTIFTFKDYNTTIEFYWAPFLLESNADNPKKHRVEDRIVRNGSIDKHGEHWNGADIIVFNTYIWWIAKLRVLRGSFDDEVKDIVKIPVDEAFRIAMKSLLKWMKENIDPKKTRILFVSLSPTHQGSNRWHGDPNGNCYSETTMIQDPTYFAARIGLMNVVSEEFSKSIVPISFLNITQLSSSRKDAHTSIYKKLYDPLTPEQIANPKSYADCIHWCLPGVPDTWNELLYSQLFYP